MAAIAAVVVIAFLGGKTKDTGNVGLEHVHTWMPADCDTPKTCTECGAIEGTAKGHSWKEATCTAPKTCSDCGVASGSVVGHSWREANCTTPEICSVCNETKGTALGHSWIDATCTIPKTCSVCGATSGNALGHSWVEATCTKPKTCCVCGTTIGEMVNHIYEDGACSICGQQKTSDGLEYMELRDDQNNLVGYALSGIGSCVDNDIIIPNVHNGLPVISIEMNAFADRCSDSFSITIPSSVTRITFLAFMNCFRITKIIVAADNPVFCSVNGVLYSKDMTELIYYPSGKTDTFFCIPDSVAIIGAGAFSHAKLTSIVIPSSVTLIKQGAFGGSHLSNISIPNSVRVIEQGVFSSCFKLTDITIPVSVTHLDSYMFAWCESLSSINYEGTVAQWYAIGKGEKWALSTGKFTVYCTDGEV